MPDELLDRFRQHDRLALSRLLSRVARGQTGEQTLAQIRKPIRYEKDQHRVRIRGPDGKRTVDLRLHDHVVAFGQAPLNEIAGRPVKVAVVLARFQETAGATQPIELCSRNEKVVLSVAFARPWRAGGGRNRVP